MSITAKELAQKLNISATAVSMALNNRPGVSTTTRNRILEAAEKYGYDLSRHQISKIQSNEIYFIAYRAYDTVLNYNGIFFEMFEGMEEECRKSNYHIQILHVNDSEIDVENIIGELRIRSTAGLILLGTTITKKACLAFLALGVPTILLDSYLDALECSSVLINNKQGAYLAAEYLIHTRKAQPGYISSTLRLGNFEERQMGFRSALRDHGLSPAKSVTHEVSPSIEGAFTDMLDIIEKGEELADCYFAENDLIAIGTIKALTLCGIKVPDEVGIIGFDNIGMCSVVQPALTSISIPRKFMGQTAARQLIYQIQENNLHPVKIEVAAKLIKRFSV
ncbi:LacI family DNA-binding transcriptional regulator [Faecalicatena sp. AGMB00832]|uniref:LacI family DNA-binding transcriptional regulator n=1 Tax=Faecalicatena faecalis TaxID=2726362 RepID=A0ABS6D5A0_9FIRM|nr:LacI family DNA-binding transcriptional regulator [Faecalicatena faecalis]MBU3876661.1 LacI family DNA-binding transcriptional regulator [Faecalicatena faecalis]